MRLLLLLLSLSLLSKIANAANPFSSNVVALNARNWRREVEDSPHAVFINICRMGWGYCQLLVPEWEKLAEVVKGTAKIAYWDTEQGPAPPLLGDIRGTPTIRLYIPKKKQKPGSNKEKNVIDYPYERKAKDLKKFLDENMPDHSEKIVNGSSDMEKFEAKAEKHGLPRALLFTRKADTMPVTKFLSTEFRRKLLLAEVKPTKKNKEIMDKYGIADLPALIVFPAEGEAPIRYEGEGFTKIKLQNFLFKYALKKMVLPEKKQQTKEPKVEDPVETKAKVEL